MGVWVRGGEKEGGQSERGVATEGGEWEKGKRRGSVARAGMEYGGQHLSRHGGHYFATESA